LNIGVGNAFGGVAEGGQKKFRKKSRGEEIEAIERDGLAS